MLGAIPSVIFWHKNDELMMSLVIKQTGPQSVGTCNQRHLHIEFIILTLSSILVCTRSTDPSNATANANNPVVLTYNGSDFAPWQGNLGINNASAESSWCASSDDPNKIQFLQLDLKVIKVIHTVAIQGHSTNDNWVTSFTISSSLDEIFWKKFKEGGTLKVIV